MDPAIPTLLLAALTAIYVVLTYRLVGETRRAADLSQAAVDRQLRLSMFPQLAVSASDDAGLVTLRLWNPGLASSADVDLLAVATYSEDDISPLEFLKQFAAPRARSKLAIHPNEEGFYGVFDHCVYGLFPPHARLEVPLQFPIPPNIFSLLLQFRDMANNNYVRLYWFMRPLSDPSSTRYSVGSLESSGFDPSPRITYSFHPTSVLSAEDGSPLPPRVADEFLPLWRASIPSGQLTDQLADVEDRGTWTHL